MLNEKNQGILNNLIIALAPSDSSSKNPLAPIVNQGIDAFYNLALQAEAFKNDAKVAELINELTKFLTLYSELAANNGYDFFQMPFDSCNERCFNILKAFISKEEDFLKIMAPGTTLIEVKLNSDVTEVIKSSHEFRPENFLRYENNKIISIAALINATANNLRILFADNSDNTYGEYHLTAQDMAKLRTITGTTSTALYDSLDSDAQAAFQPTALEEILQSLQETLSSANVKKTWLVQPTRNTGNFKRLYKKWMEIPDNQRETLKAVEIHNEALGRKVPLQTVLTAIFAQAQLAEFKEKLAQEDIATMANDLTSLVKSLDLLLKDSSNKNLNEILSIRIETISNSPNKLSEASLKLCENFESSLKDPNKRNSTTIKSNPEHSRSTAKLNEYVNQFKAFNPSIPQDVTSISELFPLVTNKVVVNLILELGTVPYFASDINPSKFLFTILREKDTALRSIFPSIVALLNALPKLQKKLDIQAAQNLIDNYFNNEDEFKLNADYFNELQPYLSKGAQAVLKTLQPTWMNTTQPKKETPPLQNLRTALVYQPFNNELSKTVSETLDIMARQLEQIDPADQKRYDKFAANVNQLLHLYWHLSKNGGNDYFQAPFDKVNKRCFKIAKGLAKSTTEEDILPTLAFGYTVYPKKKHTTSPEFKPQNFYLCQDNRKLIDVPELMDKVCKDPGILFEKHINGEECTFGTYDFTKEDLKRLRFFAGEASKELFDELKGYYRKKTELSNRVEDAFDKEINALFEVFETALNTHVRTYIPSKEEKRKDTTKYLNFATKLIRVHGENIENPATLIESLLQCIVAPEDYFDIIKLQQKELFKFDLNEFFEKTKQLPLHFLSAIKNAQPDLSKLTIETQEATAKFISSLRIEEMERNRDLEISNSRNSIPQNGNNSSVTTRSNSTASSSSSAASLISINGIHSKVSFTINSLPEIYTSKTDLDYQEFQKNHGTAVQAALDIIKNVKLEENDSIAIQIAKVFEAYANPPLFRNHSAANIKIANVMADGLRASEKRSFINLKEARNLTYQECTDYINSTIRNTRAKDPNFKINKNGTFYALLHTLIKLPALNPPAERQRLGSVGKP